jgi:hypothetical protein
MQGECNNESGDDKKELHSQVTVREKRILIAIRIITGRIGPMRIKMKQHYTEDRYETESVNGADPYFFIYQWKKVLAKQTGDPITGSPAQTYYIKWQNANGQISVCKSSFKAFPLFL